MTAPIVPEPEKKQKSKFLHGLFLFVGFVFFALFVSLGIWQVERLQWKQDLIARVNARVHAEPVEAPKPQEWANINQDRDEYRRVRLSGTYLNDKEVLVHALTERGAGYWVLTPMRSADGAITFINRGFVPGESSLSASKITEPVEGEITVTGLLRMPEPDGFFLRPNNPERNDWNSRDVEAFAQIFELGNVAPYFIDADTSTNPQKLPVGGLTVISFRNHHLSYAITWFALAAMVAAAIIFVWRQERLQKN